jgi:putative peptidoglycan binding protein
MSLHVGYQGAKECLTGPQPGARALMAWWLSRFSDRGAVNSGIYVCRNVVGGSGTRSLHSEGRAVDLGVRPNDAGYGHEAASLLHANSGELGIQCIIWSRRIWSGSKPNAGFRPYAGQNAHVDHLHVELDWVTARTLTHKRIAEVLGQGPVIRVLKLKDPNMRGDDVRRLQVALAARFPSLGLRLDGVFGPKTDKAVKKFQKSVGLTPDGDVGEKTRAALGLG